MTLPSSFPISASQINVELRRNAGDPFDMLGTNEMALAGVAGAPNSMSNFLGKTWFAVTEQGQFSSSWVQTTTINSVTFGNADANRRMFMIVHWYGHGPFDTLNSATIGGVSATVHAQTANQNGTTNQSYGIAIISAAVTSGTSGTVVLNFANGGGNGTTNTAVVASISAIRLQGSVSDAKASNCTGTCSSTSINVNEPAAGVLIAGSTGMGNSLSLSLSSGTDYLVYDTTNKGAYGGVALTGQSANATYNVTATLTGSGQNVSVAAVTWTGL